MFNLFFSGRAPSKLTLDYLETKGIVNCGNTYGRLPFNSAHTVTVPGAAAAWCDTVEQFGSGKVKQKSESITIIVCTAFFLLPTCLGHPKEVKATVFPTVFFQFG